MWERAWAVGGNAGMLKGLQGCDEEG